MTVSAFGSFICHCWCLWRNFGVSYNIVAWCHVLLECTTSTESSITILDRTRKWFFSSVRHLVPFHTSCISKCLFAVRKSTVKWLFSSMTSHVSLKNTRKRVLRKLFVASWKWTSIWIFCMFFSYAFLRKNEILTSRDNRPLNTNSHHQEDVDIALYQLIQRKVHFWKVSEVWLGQLLTVAIVSSASDWFPIDVQACLK